MAHTMAITPIVRALLESEQFLGAKRSWTAINAAQRMLATYIGSQEDLKQFSDAELRAWAGMIASELNAILEREGFGIRLSDFAPGEFGVVSILDVLVEWFVSGKVIKLVYNDVLYPAVAMDVSMQDEHTGEWHECFQGFRTAYPYPIARVSTKSGDEVYMTIADRKYEDFELVARIMWICLAMSDALVTNHTALEFPMVDIDESVELEWLIGMLTKDTSGKEWRISQALQQTKFKMNQFGARTKSAVAMGFFATSARERIRDAVLRINKPFFLWKVRPGVKTPILCAYIDESNWKDPGDLANI